jgi:hypothetical protein
MAANRSGAVLYFLLTQRVGTGQFKYKNPPQWILVLSALIKKNNQNRFFLRWLSSKRKF